MKRTFCIAGKNNIAVDIVNYVRQRYAEHELVVITDACDDGKDSWQKSLKYYANKVGVQEISLQDAYGIDNLVFISTEYDRIIKPELFASDELFNVHFSLLPKYKGMHICLLHILNDEAKAGCTFHKIDRGIDTGDILKQRAFEIKEHYSARDLYARLIGVGTELVKDCIPLVLSGNYEAVPQSAVHSSYHTVSDFSYKDFKVNLNQTAWGIGRQIKALVFREYQLPTVFGYLIFEYAITDRKSTDKPGMLLDDHELYIRVSSIDYDILLYKDMFSQAIELIINTPDSRVIQKLERIPCLASYLNETDGRNRRLIDIARDCGNKAAEMYLKSLVETQFMFGY